MSKAAFPCRKAPLRGVHNESHSRSIEDAADTKAKPKAEPDVDGLRLAVMKRAGESRPDRTDMLA